MSVIDITFLLAVKRLESALGVPHDAERAAAYAARLADIDTDHATDDTVLHDLRKVGRMPTPDEWRDRCAPIMTRPTPPPVDARGKCSVCDGTGFAIRYDDAGVRWASRCACRKARAVAFTPGKRRRRSA